MKRIAVVMLLFVYSGTHTYSAKKLKKICTGSALALAINSIPSLITKYSSDTIEHDDLDNGTQYQSFFASKKQPYAFGFSALLSGTAGMLALYQKNNIAKAKQHRTAFHDQISGSRSKKLLQQMVQKPSKNTLLGFSIMSLLAGFITTQIARTNNQPITILENPT